MRALRNRVRDSRAIAHFGRVKRPDLVRQLEAHACVLLREAETIRSM